LELYQTILQRFPDIYFIASGGVSAMEDLMALQEIGCSAAIVGKAIYEKRITLQQLADWKK
jgi:phosphoribosylformimino-5-aminoimidazole carboxamide ribotide isomerase